MTRLHQISQLISSATCSLSIAKDLASSHELWMRIGEITDRLYQLGSDLHPQVMESIRSQAELDQLPLVSDDIEAMYQEELRESA